MIDSTPTLETAFESVPDPTPAASVQAPAKVTLELKACSQSFMSEGRQVEVIKNISFKAEGDECIALLGPSGCGKSTILRMVSGMHPRGQLMPTSGEAVLNGTPGCALEMKCSLSFRQPS